MWCAKDSIMNIDDEVSDANAVATLLLNICENQYTQNLATPKDLIPIVLSYRKFKITANNADKNELIRMGKLKSDEIKKFQSQNLEIHNYDEYQLKYINDLQTR